MRAVDYIKRPAKRLAWQTLGMLGTLAAVLSLPSMPVPTVRPFISAQDTSARQVLALNPSFQTAKLTAASGEAAEAFGAAIATSGSTVVVGAPQAKVGSHIHQGAIYVYRQSEPGWAGLVPVARLTTPAGVEGEHFGSSVAIAGTTIVVGAPGATISGHTGQGAAYAFSEPAGVWSGSVSSATLSASDGTTGDSLGSSVAISGATIVAGAPAASGGGAAGQGVVYEFSKPAGGWSTATQTAELTASDTEDRAALGSSVAVSGPTIVAGAPNAPGGITPGPGAAYVFTEPPSGWVSTGTQTAELKGAGGAEGDKLGEAVAISGPTILAGAPGASISGHREQGAAYVFDQPAGGWVGSSQTETATLSAADGATGDHLGTSVSILGRTALAGAPSNGGAATGQGAAYLFDESAGGWTSGTQTAKLTAADGASEDHLGEAVALGGAVALAGAPHAMFETHAGQGAAYAFATAPAEVESGSASAVTETGALLSGTVNPGGTPLSACSFEFGTSSAYGASVPCAQGSSSASTPVQVSAALSGLVPGSTYHYRLVAGNDAGATAAADATFTTASSAPEIISPPLLPTAPEPHAAFTPPPASSLHVDSSVLFDAAATDAAGARAISFTWTVHGAGVYGGTASVSCGADTSELATSFQGSGPVEVSLHAASVVGTMTSATDTVAVTGTTKHWSGTHVSQWFLCRRAPSDPAVQATEHGGPPVGCQESATYETGLIEAIGCFEVAEEENALSRETKEALGQAEREARIRASDESAPALAHAGSGCAYSCGEHHGKLYATHPSGSDFYARTAAGTSGPPFLIAHGEVRINGLDIKPVPGTVLVLDMRDGLLACAEATVSTLEGRMVLFHGPLALPTSNQGGDIAVLDTEIKAVREANPSLKSILEPGGFPLTGTMHVDLVNQASKLTFNVELPSLFTNSEGGPVTLPAEAQVSNASGLDFNHFVATLPEANLGFPELHIFEVQDAQFCYQQHVSEGFCQSQQKGITFGGYEGSTEPSWNATMKLIFGGQSRGSYGATLNATPPYGIGFVGGNLAFAGADASFSPGIPIFTGVSLREIGFNLGLNPFRASGTIGVKVAKYVVISGTLFLVVASPQTPYKFTGYELGEHEHKLPKVTSEGFALAVGGRVGLSLPVLGTTWLGNGFVMYVYPAYVATGGEFNLNLFSEHLVVKGGIEGELNAESGEFNINGSVFAKVNVEVAGAEGEIKGAVSSTGIGLCGRAKIWAGPFSWHGAAAVGHRWNEPLDLGHIHVWFPSSEEACNLSEYETVVSASQARAARNSYTVHVPGGVPSEMIELPGTGGAPDVAITGPDGIHASSSGDGREAFNSGFVVFRDPSAHATLIGIMHPRAGTYTITPNPGSAQIAGILRAHTYRPAIQAHVTGRGTRRTLSYSVKPLLPGERVMFAERTGKLFHVLGSAAGARGRLTFRPAPGPGGAREIVAQMTRGGAPMVVNPNGTASLPPSDIALSSYRAPGPRRLGAVGRIQTRHSHTALTIAFGAVPGAERYALTVKLSDGTRRLVLTRSHSVVLQHIFGEVGGHVRVRAIGDGASTLDGPATVAPIAPLAPVRIGARHTRRHHRRRGRHVRRRHQPRGRNRPPASGRH